MFVIGIILAIFIPITILALALCTAAHDGDVMFAQALEDRERGLEPAFDWPQRDSE